MEGGMSNWAVTIKNKDFLILQNHFNEVSDCRTDMDFGTRIVQIEQIGQDKIRVVFCSEDDAKAMFLQLSMDLS
jgi:hypothetical protein